VSSGDVVYRITGQIQRRLAELVGTGGLERFPRLLAFSSVVDATISAPALVEGRILSFLGLSSG
jgi:hypothetical protein